MTETPYFSPIPFRISRPNFVNLDANHTALGRKIINLGEQFSLNAGETTETVAAFPACSDLLRYWQNLRGARQMPERTAFDPRGIEQSLACCFVAEKVAPRVARMRVAGSTLSEMLGMDVRGMPITALFDPNARDAVADASRDVFEGPSMAVLNLHARRGLRRPALDARMVLLPMSDAFGKATRMVGCLDIVGGLGKLPRRFEVSAVSRVNLTGQAPVASPVQAVAAPQPMKQHTPNYQFAENSAEYTASTSAKKHHGLRLVVNNDTA